MDWSSQMTWKRILIAVTLCMCWSVIGLAAPTRAPIGGEDVAFAQAPEAEDAAPVITVDLTQTFGKINPRAFGLILGNKGHNIAEPTYFFRTAQGNQDLRDFGVRTLYYWVDRDDWRNPYDSYTAEPAPPASVMYTDEFLNLNNALGAEPMISVNITNLCWRRDDTLPYSSSNVQCKMATASDAKAWLAYIKSTGIRDVQYVMLGVEPYAGCSYWDNPAGVNCVTHQGEHKIQLTQDEYAKRVAAWAKALHQVDRKIKIGVQLQPNTFICKTDCNNVSWDQTLLKRVGDQIDFVVTHQYFQIDAVVSDEAAAQKYSYYQEQTDIRVDKGGVTAMPKQIRQELLKWLPTKKNIPIVTGEFNASRTNGKDNIASVNTRMSLYAGFGVAEGYLDSLAPVKYERVVYPGVSRVIFLDLHTLPVMFAHFLPLNNPTTLVKTPAWHMLAALQEMQGKTWVKTKVKNNPQTPVGRPALRVYAVKQNKDVWLAVFNHSTNTPLTTNINFIGTTPVSATTTVIGDTAPSFLTQNTPDNPTAIALTTAPLPEVAISSNSLTGIVFPAHSLTVIQLQGK
jgi:alpha-L-arabinofuranosidase